VRSGSRGNTAGADPLFSPIRQGSVPDQTLFRGSLRSPADKPFETPAFSAMLPRPFLLPGHIRYG